MKILNVDAEFITLDFSMYKFDATAFSCEPNIPENEKYIGHFKNSNIFRSINYFLEYSQTIRIPKILYKNYKIYDLNLLLRNEQFNFETIMNLHKSRIFGINKTLAFLINGDINYTNYYFGPFNGSISYVSKKENKDLLPTTNVILCANTDETCYKFDSNPNLFKCLLRYNNFNFCIIMNSKIGAFKFEDAKFKIKGSDNDIVLNSEFFNLVEKKDNSYVYKIRELLNLPLVYNDDVSRIFFYDDFYKDASSSSIPYCFEFEYLAYALELNPITFLKKYSSDSENHYKHYYSTVRAELEKLFKPI